MGRKKKKEKKEKKEKKADAQKGETKRLDLQSGVKRGILGVVIVAIAVIIFLSFLNIAGNVGFYINLGVRRLFGWGGFFFPLALIILAVSLFRSGETKVYRSTLLGLFLFLLGFLGVLFTSTGVSELITVAHEGGGGGYVGLILAYPLQRLFGAWAAAVIEIAILIIGFIVTANISWDEIKERWHSLWNKEEKGDEEAEEKGDAEEIDEKQQKTKFGFRKSAPFSSRSGQSQGRKSSSEMKIQSYRPDTKWKLPEVALLDGNDTEPLSGNVEENAEIIKKTFEQFGIQVEMSEVSIGPTVTQYTLKPAEGVKLTRITTLTDDLALALAAHPIRIEAPIPGKSLVGVEVPNQEVALVHIKNLLSDPTFTKSKHNLVFSIGRDVAGDAICANLEKMPHLLVAGATGSGKSVCINAIIASLLYRNSPRQMKFIMIDPKRVELTTYNGIPHLLTPVITDPQKAVNALQWVIGEMDRRYRVLEDSGSRNIFSFNEKTKDVDEKLPFLVVIIDELADLMTLKGKEVEASVVRLAQMARAVGIHLIVSTQRPSVDVLTGLIKANIPTRVAFQVPTQIDSRTILDGSGAEKLLGNGDMLYLSSESKKPVRLQGSFVSEKNVRRLVNFWVDQIKEHVDKEEAEAVENIEITSPQRHSSIPGISPGGGAGDDELYEEARTIVAETGKASASYLQRRLRIGYARAARLLDMLEENGVVGQASGSKPREVLVSSSEKGAEYDDPNEDDDRRANWQI